MNKLIFFFLIFSPLSYGEDKLKSIVKNIDWNEVKLPFIPTVQTQNKHYKVSFFDDFKGKPDNSTESNYCYDTLKPQCSIWSGYEGLTFPCDFSHLSLTDPGPTPPMKANFKSALYSLNPLANYESLTLSGVKSAYANTLNARWKDINKCNWTSYLTVNWMATDYNGQYSAKMDPTQVSIDTRGKGYLILSARKGKIVEQCIFGGTIGPTVGIVGKSCLIKNVQNVLRGPLNIYWIDPDIKWPGIFYHKINGGCPYGGSGSVNCMVHAFAPSELSPLISYHLLNYNGNATVYYRDIHKYACGMNVEYPNNGVVFNKLACPILNGGILSQKAIDATNHKNGFVQKGGIFEVKLKIPKGKGAFPAAWLMPIKGGWPYSGGEIDIMEARDNANEVYQTFHQGKCIDSVTKTEIIYDPNNPSVLIDNGNCQKIPNAASINYFKGHTTPENEAQQFHTRDHIYSVEWSDSKIQWYLNNRPTNMIAPGVSPEGTHFNNTFPGLAQNSDIPTNLFEFDNHNMPHDPFYLILNHSTWVASADLPSWTEQHHYIDYVKVYSECKTQNDFCPQGGTFVEGTGCVVSGIPKARSTTYPSVCVSKIKARTCPAGGEAAGPYCQVHGFERPKVIPGVNYWIDSNPNYPGVYYEKVNGACPFGGGAGVNCQFETLSPVLSAPQNKTVTPGIQYWVDTNPAWPGIYYKKINGSCPLGGSGSVNCQLKSYAANFVKPGINYWIDTNPAYPGVYYKKINNACPFGGSVGVNCQLEALAVPSFYLNPTVSYWLDTNITYPGINYAKIGGGCPYGGSGSINCQIKAYPKPTTPYIMPNVNYWIDPNPDYPGIYYAKINGACPFGGSVGVNCQLMAFPSGKVEPGIKYWIDKNPSYPGVYYAPDFR
jgi:beta-glucanase (GH16 family)